MEVLALHQKGLTWTLFFDKAGVCVRQSHNSIKTLVHHRVFPQNILFKAASIRYIFQKNVRWSLFIVELQSVHCSLVTLLKQTPLFPNFHNQLFFVTSSFVLKNQTTRKITWKSVEKGRLVSEALWKYNEYWIFLCERFSFYEKVPSPPKPAGLFSKWSLMEFLFSKLLACKLQPNSLCVFTTPGITSPVDFLSTETSANRLSTEQVL